MASNRISCYLQLITQFFCNSSHLVSLTVFDILVVSSATLNSSNSVYYSRVPIPSYHLRFTFLKVVSSFIMKIGLLLEKFSSWKCKMNILEQHQMNVFLLL